MQWLDRLYTTLAPPLGCFPGGWGDPAFLARPLDAIAARTEERSAQIRWRGARAGAKVRLDEGELESPEDALPAEARLARVRLISPRHGRASALAVGLAAWNEETFTARARLYAPLAEHGVAVMLLENPFYGARRRVAQEGSRLGTVSDFVLMGRATVRESHALLAWAEARGFDRVGVVGFSMGGQMAAMSAALAPRPVRVVAMAPAVTPASVFLDGPLRRDVAWGALGERGVTRLREILGGLSVLALPKVADPSLATLVGTRHDLIVPPEDVVAIGKHWGVTPRWLPDGHVSAIALRSRALAQAVIDTFLRA